MKDFTLKEFPQLDSIDESSISPDDDQLVYDSSVGTVKRVSKAQSRLDRTTPIDSVASFASIDLTYLQDRQQFALLSFRPDNSEQGGPLYWDAEVSRTAHNGINIFSPTVPAPADFNNEFNLIDYRNGVGEEFPAALGCFVRVGGAGDDTLYERQIFTGSEGQTDFTLTEFNYLPDQDPSTLRVYVNGIFQMEDQITELSSNTFRVIAGVSDGDSVYAATNTDLSTSTAIAENYAEQAKGYRDTTLTYRNDAEGFRDETEDLKDLAEASLESFEELYLGPKTSSPATDNEGNPLQVGALYLQSIPPEKGMKYWDGSAWVDAYASINISTSAWPIDITQTGDLSVNTYWYVDTSAERSRDLPASPTDNDEIHILDNVGSASENNITIGRNGSTIMGLEEDLVVKTNFARFTLKYNSGDWRIVK